MRRVVLVAALALGLVQPALAQDRLTVFLHGFNSNAGTWWGTATRLQGRLQVAAALPELPWHVPFDAQANHLNGLANSAGAPADMVVVGHSNGGLVARQLSTKRPLGGIVSLGTPHLGAPLAQNVQGAALHYLNTGQQLSTLLWMLGATHTNQFSGIWFSPRMALVRAAVAVLGAVLGQTVNDIALNIWPIVTAPVLTDMKPGSSALSYLNSGGNLGRESAAVPRRVGMVYTARDWWLGAPFVAAAPERQYLGPRRCRCGHQRSRADPGLLRLPELRAVGRRGPDDSHAGLDDHLEPAHLQLGVVLRHELRPVVQHVDRRRRAHARPVLSW